MVNWPKYYKERLWLGDVDSGFVGVVTLWTPVEVFSSLIDDQLKKKVSVIGQLHTKRGIESVFKNVWLNPKIRYLVLSGEDGCGAGDALVEWMKTGKIKSLFFDGIKKKYVDIFRKKVELIDMRGKNGDEVIEVIKKLRKRKPFSLRRKTFAESEISGNFSSENSVFRVSAETIGEGWVQVLDLIVRFGRKVPRIHVYGGYERVLLDMAVVISGENIANPKMWSFFQFNKDDLRAYFRSFFMADRGSEAYTYGERLFAYEAGGKKIDQVAEMAKKLSSFAHNKGAVAVLWQPEIDNFPVRKPWRTPCLTLVQGFCMEGKLFVTAYFRSNDMFGAWPQNAFALRKLQTEVAKRIGKKVGDLTVISHCAFVDEANIVEAQSVVGKNNRLFCQLDPRGNLLVEVIDDDLVVKHLSGEGELVAEYRQHGKVKKAAEKMLEKLLKEKVVSRVDHGMDIACQLTRAEMAVKMGLKFEQDKGLK